MARFTNLAKIERKLLAAEQQALRFVCVSRAWRIRFLNGSGAAETTERLEQAMLAMTEAREEMTHQLQGRTS